jgi:hypothetical protein
MNCLDLSFIPFMQAVNLDSILDAIFGLEQISALGLACNQISLDMIESLLRKQGGKKLWEKVDLGRLDQEVGDSDILEVCSYLPNLCRWSVLSPRATIDGAKEWKRICPELETVQFAGGGLSEEVKEVLQGRGVTAI